MCNKVVDNYALEFFLDWYKSQDICDKAVHNFPFKFDSFPRWCKTQETFDEAVSDDPFMLKYWFDKYKTQ